MIKHLIILLSIISFSGAAQAQENAPSQKEIEIYQRDIATIEHYLNKITTLVSSFTQIDSENNVSQGTFYLSRPGKLRWEYFPPSPILIIAKGSMLTYYDSELDQVSHISLDDNLSGFLTQKVISFSDENIKIISYFKDDKEISITIAQKDKEEEGQLTLVFSSDSFELTKMKILDAIGKETKVSFDTIVYDKPLDSQLFSLPKIRKK